MLQFELPAESRRVLYKTLVNPQAPPHGKRPESQRP